MFVVYEENGMISQTISGPDRTYDELLDKAGYKWLFHEGETSLDIRFNYVDVATKKIVPCADMKLSLNATSIRADNIDTAIIESIPADALVQMYCNDVPHLSETVTDSSIEFSTPTAATYKFCISCPKYLYTELLVVAE